MYMSVVYMGDCMEECMYVCMVGWWRQRLKFNCGDTGDGPCRVPGSEHRVLAAG